MFMAKHKILLALGFCVLLLPMTVGVKRQVERPFQLHGQSTVTLNLQDGTFTIVEESGEATHLGRYTASGEGTVDLLTGHLEADGSYTAANGDMVFWTLTQDGPGASPSFTVTGGAGRFEGATGSWTVTIFDETTNVEFPVLTIEHSFRGSGTITY
jgi:hypothetical protein